MLPFSILDSRETDFKLAKKLLHDRLQLLAHDFPGTPQPRVLPPVLYPALKQKMLTNTVDKGKMLSQFMGYLIKYPNGMMEYI